MANLRIVYNNVANQAVSLTASTTAGSLAASNLLTDYKTEVWRSTGTAGADANLIITWGGTVQISMAALAFTNLTPAATMRVRLFTLADDLVPAVDLDHIPCCAGSFGGETYASRWFTETSAQKLWITIADTTNTAGFVQAARVIVGTYWSPERNAESESVQAQVQDDSKHFRSEAGALWTDRGPQYKKLSFDLNYMTTSDRNSFWRILRENGMHTSVYVSLVPESSDTYDEQIHSIYGRLSSTTALTYRWLGTSATKLQLEEI